jgi:hypothetical protein
MQLITEDIHKMRRSLRHFFPRGVPKNDDQAMGVYAMYVRACPQLFLFVCFVFHGEWDVQA